MTDSVEGVTEYIYNALGQLTREIRSGADTDVKYDAYNNIQEKGGKEYQYDNKHKDHLIKCWMLYYHGKQPRSISHRKAATFDQMMKFLKQNHLF